MIKLKARTGTLSRQELDAVMVGKIMAAIKSTNDLYPKRVSFQETDDTVILILEFHD